MPSTQTVDCSTGAVTLVPLTAEQLAARQAEATAAQQAEATEATRTANGATIGAKLDTALANNATYLALASPTAAQTTAQVKALTRQVSALIRLERRNLDDTAGT